MDEVEKLEKAIAGLEIQRAILGDDVVKAAVSALREKISLLQAEIQPERRKRKIASVLFADVSGFTAMSERMDPEDVSDLMNRLWERIDQVIIDHGGRIDKHIGDAVMALWGTEAVREDDPERSVRAALAVQIELAKITRGEGFLDARFRGEAQELAIRVAVHTGPVLWGQTGTTGEYSAIGDTVNTASRMQHQAPLGGVVVSAATALHIQGLFDLEVLEPLKAKGKSEPVRIFRVLRPKPRAYAMRTRGVMGISTPLVGRDAELNEMVNVLEHCVQNQSCCMLTITGEAGIGKSRLQYEFEKCVEQSGRRYRILRGRAGQDMVNQPYALLRDLFSNAFQIQDSDTREEVWQKFEQGIATPYRLPEQDKPLQVMQAHFIGQLLGFNFNSSAHLVGAIKDAKQLHDRALVYLIAFFRAMAEQEPVIIFLDDLHWADESSLDHLIHIFRALNHLRILFVCMARPTLFERRPGWGSGKGHTQIKLQPLAFEASQKLLEHILQKLEDIPENLRDMIIQNAEGNPYYIEELVKMLVENGVIIQTGEQWRVVSERLQVEQIPSTLAGILQARLDSLTELERDTLQCSAVVGQTFWNQAVQTLNPDAFAELDETLAELNQRELIEPSEVSAFADSTEYVFRHHILYGVTYDSVLKSLRRQYHAQIARWLIAHEGERAGEFSGLIADHLEKAERYDEAVVYLRKAGERAIQSYANNEGVQYFSRAIHLTAEDDYAAQYQLRLARENLNDLLGERAAQAQELDALDALNDHFDASQQAEIAIRRANLHLVTGNYAIGLEAARKATALAEKSKDSRHLATALMLQAQALWRLNQRPEAHALLLRALELASTVEQAETRSDVLRMLGNLAYDQDIYAEARSYFEQSLEICRQIGFRRGECAVLNSLGILLNRINRGSDEALGCYLEALNAAHEMGDRHQESLVLVNLGIAYRSRRAYDQAIQIYERALRIQEEIDDPLHQSATLINLSILMNYQDRRKDALRLLEQAIEIKQRIGDQRGESIALSGIGIIWNYLGQYQRAEENFLKVLQIRRAIGERRGEINALSNLTTSALGQGELGLALDYAQRAVAVAEEIQIPQSKAYGYQSLGDVLYAHLRYQEAVQYYQQAVELFETTNDLEECLSTRSKIALAFLALGQLDAAQTEVEVVFRQIEKGLETPEDSCPIPLVVYQAGYRVLAASQSAKAQQVLETGYQALMQKADQIDDSALRQSFLGNVAENRELLAAYEQAQQL
ncbi:MAG TPA: tetratricopeptide repeat protein [Anaerolineaceae bacterium]|nr:tetratricopeptide repeat protein [Anaerolineaceae bacterium]